MYTEKIYWQETMSCPLGYPVEIYRGGLESITGSFTSLYLGLHTGKGGWGHTGRSMSSGIKTIPDHINTIWLSYAEDCFYHIDCDIDYIKMLEYFKKGLKSRDGYDKMRDEKYDYIITGFAPGGVVVLWLSGIGKQVEIGRYQGKKITISPEEIAKLDSHERLLFDANHKKSVLEDEMVIPLAVQAANKNKPIPYGLWDTYRVRYMWRSIFETQQKGKIGDYGFDYFNGEQDEIFAEDTTQHEYANLPVPKDMGFFWRDKTGQQYRCYIEFNEQEIYNAFAELFKGNKIKSAEFYFRVNLINTYVTVMLKGIGKEVALRKNKLIIFPFKK